MLNGEYRDGYPPIKLGQILIAVVADNGIRMVAEYRKYNVWLRLSSYHFST